MKNANEFLVRCSSLGKVMTDPQEKTPADKYADAVAKRDEKMEKYRAITDPKKLELVTNVKLKQSIVDLNTEIMNLEPIKDKPYLGATCKSELLKLHRGIVWNRFKSFKSKQTTKGNVQEDETLALWHTNHKEYVFPTRNTDRFKNSFLTGMPDIQDDGKVLPFDLKTSWDWTSFPDPNKPLDKDYEWQGFGYADIFQVPTWTFVHGLVNTPPVLIEMEFASARRSLGLAYNAEPTEALLLAQMEIEKNCIVDRARFEADLKITGYPYLFQIAEADWEFDIPVDERMVETVSHWTQEKQDRAYTRIKEVRMYLTESQPKYWII